MNVFGLKFVLPDLRQEALPSGSAFDHDLYMKALAFTSCKGTTLRATTVVISVSLGMTVCVVKCFGMGQLPLTRWPQTTVLNVERQETPRSGSYAYKHLVRNACTLPSSSVVLRYLTVHRAGECKNTLNKTALHDFHLCQPSIAIQQLEITLGKEMKQRKLHGLDDLIDDLMIPYFADFLDLNDPSAPLVSPDILDKNCLITIWR